MASIIIAEDKASMRMLMNEILSADHEVRAVEDGALALTEMQRKTPDLLITDLNMPVMNGYELLGRLHEETGYSGPVLVCTSSNIDQLGSLGYTSGRVEKLKKPFHLHNFTTLVDVLLK